MLSTSDNVQRDVDVQASERRLELLSKRLVFDVLALDWDGDGKKVERCVLLLHK